MSNMTSMKMTAQEVKADTVITKEDNKPRYPWGLRVDLNDDSLSKLGITNLPAVGEKMNLMATVEVTSVSSHSSGNNNRKSVELQITEMALEKPSKKNDAANTLYPDTNQ